MRRNFLAAWPRALGYLCTTLKSVIASEAKQSICQATQSGSGLSRHGACPESLEGVFRNDGFCKSSIGLRLGMIALGGLLLGAEAIPDLHVVGLFPDRAAVRIDGKVRVLRVGKTSPEGVTLMRADSREAVLQIDGVERVFRLHEGRFTPVAPAETQRVAIVRDPRGMFVTQGSINGAGMEMLVDTGASAVAVGSQIADRLGLDYRLQGTRVRLMTASGIADGWRVNLKSVKVGGFEQRDVQGVVVEGQPSHTVLLGMSFLNGMNLNYEGNILYLEAKP
jgi:aspartyl protease family protein